MKSSPILRVLMAAGMYLLLMWGYVMLPTPQLYAVFVALIMSIALLFWVSEARAVLEDMDTNIEVGARGEVDHSAKSNCADEPTLSASIVRLDSLKDELTEQYAQFGRDQSTLNSHGLGTWNKRGGQIRGDQ